jgi:hypothetical protein
LPSLYLHLIIYRKRTTKISRKAMSQESREAIYTSRKSAVILLGLSLEKKRSTKGVKRSRQNTIPLSMSYTREPGIPKRYSWSTPSNGETNCLGCTTRHSKVHFKIAFMVCLFLTNFTAVATSKPTAKKLMAASKALSNWRGVADITGEVDSAAFQRREDELASLWTSLGRSRVKGTGAFATPSPSCVL